MITDKQNAQYVQHYKTSIERAVPGSKRPIIVLTYTAGKVAIPELDQALTEAGLSVTQEILDANLILSKDGMYICKNQKKTFLSSNFSTRSNSTPPPFFFFFGNISNVISDGEVERLNKIIQTLLDSAPEDALEEPVGLPIGPQLEVQQQQQMQAPAIVKRKEIENVETNQRAWNKLGNLFKFKGGNTTAA